MSRSIARVAACAAALGLAGCADPPDDAGERSSAIVGGMPSTRGSVVLVTPGAGTCSGTLLAPNLVLTAHHCVAPLGQPFACTTSGQPEAPVDGGGYFGALKDPTTFVFGDYGNTPEAPHGKQIFVSQDQECASDIALVLLDRDFDDPVLAPVRLDSFPAVGDALVVAGYGLTSSGPNMGRQERSTAVVELGPVAATAQYTGVAPNFFVTGEVACSGDSGGPAFAASGAVVGVLSYVNNPSVTVPTGTAADCMGANVHDVYEGTSAEKALITSAYAAAQATPWLEGQPDPRASLAPTGAACTADADCQSNVCVAAPDGTKTCSHGCLGGVACGAGYVCTDDGKDSRCTPMPVADMASAKPTHGGCDLGDSGGSHGAAWALALVLVAWARHRGRASGISPTWRRHRIASAYPTAAAPVSSISTES